MSKKDIVVVAAAIIIPGGLVILGLWKAYEMLNKKPTPEEDKSKTDQ